MRERKEIMLAAIYMVLPLLSFLIMAGLISTMHAINPSYPFGTSEAGNLASVLAVVLVVGYCYYRSVSFYIAHMRRSGLFNENE